jgi:hypothetical protein
LEDRLKDLMLEFGEAIDESLSESNRVAVAIDAVKRAGYDVHIVLEVTIGLSGDETGAQRLAAGGRAGKITFTITQEPAQEPDDAT